MNLILKAEQDYYDIPIYSYKTERPSPIAMSTAQEMARIYAPSVLRNDETKHSAATPLLARCSPMNTGLSTGKQKLFSLNDSYYATTDLLNQFEVVTTLPTDTSSVASDHFKEQLMQIAPKKLNRINRLSRGLFGEEVSSFCYTQIIMIRSNIKS